MINSRSLFQSFRQLPINCHTSRYNITNLITKTIATRHITSTRYTSSMGISKNHKYPLYFVDAIEQYALLRIHYRKNHDNKFNTRAAVAWNGA